MPNSSRLTSAGSTSERSEPSSTARLHQRGQAGVERAAPAQAASSTRAVAADAQQQGDGRLVGDQHLDALTDHERSRS